MNCAVDLALAAEAQGNVAVGAVIVLDQKIIAQGSNSMYVPHYHPGRHAEQEALRSVPGELWERAWDMTCYSTLEPCTMCMGTLLVHGIGRIVFGASDNLGGGTCLIPHLPRFFETRLPQIQGPIQRKVCDPIAKRVIANFE